MPRIATAGSSYRGVDGDCVDGGIDGVALAVSSAKTSKIRHDASGDGDGRDSVSDDVAFTAWSSSLDSETKADDADADDLARMPILRWRCLLPQYGTFFVSTRQRRRIAVAAAGIGRVGRHETARRRVHCTSSPSTHCTAQLAVAGAASAEHPLE